MKVGFIGTPAALTEAQKRALASLLEFFEPKRINHPDRVGAVLDFYRLAVDKGLDCFWAYPYSLPSEMAGTECSKYQPARRYPDANQAILLDSEVLWVAMGPPDGPTDHAIELARVLGSSVCLVFPDGREEWTPTRPIVSQS